MSPKTVVVVAVVVGCCKWGRLIVCRARTTCRMCNVCGSSLSLVEPPVLSLPLPLSLTLSLCYYKHLLVHPLLGNLILAHSGNLVPRGLPLPIIVIVIVKLLKPQTKRLKGLSLTRVYIWHNWVYIASSTIYIKIIYLAERQCVVIQQ